MLFAMQYNIQAQARNSGCCSFCKMRIRIKAYPSIVPDADLKRYCDLFDSIVGKADKRKRGVDALMDLATQRQDAAAFSLIEKKLKTSFCPFY